MLMMIMRAFLSLVLLIDLNAWSQSVPAATGIPVNHDEDTQMRMPPPLSGEPYPLLTAAESHSNFMRAGLQLTAGYNDNVLPSSGARAISDVTFSMWPTLALDQTTSRLHQTFTCSPGFTVYQHTTGLDANDLTASVSLTYRSSQHGIVSLRDSFQKSSNIFSQPSFGSGNPITGSQQSSAAGLLAPWANQMANAASGEYTYQFSLNGMIGAGGTTTRLDYLNKSQAPGLADSTSRGGSAFYGLRLSSARYTGVMYQYLEFSAHSALAASDTQTHSVNLFYTFYPMHQLSLSALGGPQYYHTAQHSFHDAGSWTPTVRATASWQGMYTNIALSYQRTVTGEGGMIGSFHSNSASASVRWLLTPSWTVAASADYDIWKNADPVSISSSVGGHTVLGSVAIERTITQHLKAEARYQRLHQTYGNPVGTSITPDSDRESVSLSYQFEKPLGR